MTSAPEAATRLERINAVDVPEGWEPVARLCRAVHINLDDVAARCAKDIRSSISAYASPAVADEELHNSVVTNMDLLLTALVEHRNPRPNEIEVLRDLGGLRASQGMSISDVNEAFHIGYRHVWERLVTHAAGADDATRSMLLDAATTMWAWTHYTGDALGSSHAAVTHDLAVRAAAIRYRFLELLTSGPIEAEELALLGRSLGFDVNGRFQASVYATGEPLPDDATALQRALGDLPGVHQVVARGTVLSVLGQPGDGAAAAPDDVDRAIRRALVVDVVGGIGRERVGLRGARTSLGDASRAAAIAAPGATVHFDDEWLMAVLHDDADRLDDLLHAGAEVVAANPGLAETVQGYAESGFSPARTAERLFVHPNTVAYRLRRWHELTGWDPRSFDGLSRSMACIRCAERR